MDHGIPSSGPPLPMQSHSGLFANCDGTPRPSLGETPNESASLCLPATKTAATNKHRRTAGRPVKSTRQRGGTRMALEPAGYANKLGNRYEGRWIARQLLFLLHEQLRSVKVEAPGDDEAGVDLWVERKDGNREAQQCKAENGSKSRWTLGESRRSLCSDQTFVRRNTLNISPPQSLSQFPFVGNRRLQQSPGSKVALEESRTLRQWPHPQRFQLVSTRPAITKLGRLGFPPGRYRNHDQCRNDPIRHNRLSSRPGPRARLLRLLTTPHRQPHELPKQFSRRYTDIHPWISGVVSVSLHNENQLRSKDLCQHEFPDGLTPSRGHGTRRG